MDQSTFGTETTQPPSINCGWLGLGGGPCMTQETQANTTTEDSGYLYR
jgi:hypothetical protein